MATNTRDDVKAYFAAVVTNNPIGAIKCFNQNGFTFDISSSTKDLFAKFIDLYDNGNRSMAFQIAKCVPFNKSAKNYTTDPQFISQVKQYARDLNQTSTSNAKLGDNSSWITDAGDVLGGSSQSETTSTTNTPVSSNVNGWVTVAIIVVVIVAFVFYMKK